MVSGGDAAVGGLVHLLDVVGAFLVRDSRARVVGSLGSAPLLSETGGLLIPLALLDLEATAVVGEACLLSFLYAAQLLGISGAV